MDTGQDKIFRSLMQNRINKVLVICSKYDFFMLEEDGRIDEQIFIEYVSLNLRYPPVFIHAETKEAALSIMENDDIDLVIPMLSIIEVDTFQLAREIKEKYPATPIVLLTHFSRDVSLRMQHENLSSIDHIFSWLGNSDIFLAIIKMIEDNMNAEHDVLGVGVQVILLVEDSVRYISSYLPNLYKIVLEQSKYFAMEALNEHQQMLRRRGRPKILMAKNYQDALHIYKKYENNILGVISDVSYKKNAITRDTEKKAGLKLCEYIRKENKNIPILLQSSDKGNQTCAIERKAGFIHKYSPDLIHELKDYILDYFGFGDFIFIDPQTRKEVARATDLKSMHQCLRKVPDDVLLHHAGKDDISKWLNARALFDIAMLFKQKSYQDFESVSDMRGFIVDSIDHFRFDKAKGVIARFVGEKYDKYLRFSRIGDGSLGGKARGLAFMNTILEQSGLQSKYPKIQIRIPAAIVLTTEVFDDFLDTNHLYREHFLQLGDEKILEIFLAAKLPESVQKDIEIIAMRFSSPVAVRSSSKLEDSYYQPFAGIYKTFMIPFSNNKGVMSQMIEQAIKSVYASVFYKSSIAYITSTSNVMDEEKMGVIIQEVCGSYHGKYFYPTMSGVARSVNYYPIPPEKSNRGIVNIAYGLGKFIVDGNTSLRFSPDYPKKIIQLSSPDLALKSTQSNFYALNSNPGKFHPSTNDTVNIEKLPISWDLNDNAMAYAFSSYSAENNMITDFADTRGLPVVTFANILKYNKIPFCNLLNDLLKISSQALNNHVEIEFALDVKNSNENNIQFNYLQVRPILKHSGVSVHITKENIQSSIIYSTKALGSGSYNDTTDIVFIDPETYRPKNAERLKKSLSQINSQFLQQGRGYILIGPGRWGSSDPNLGISVGWDHISAAKIIVEICTDNFNTEPSQGTHFFHNLTNMGVGYMFIGRQAENGHYNLGSIKGFGHKLHPDIVHFKLTTPFDIYFDGIEQKGVVMVNQEMQ